MPGKNAICDWSVCINKDINFGLWVGFNLNPLDQKIFFFIYLHNKISLQLVIFINQKALIPTFIPGFSMINTFLNYLDAHTNLIGLRIYDINTTQNQIWYEIN